MSTAEEWQGMYRVAAARADAAEELLQRLADRVAELEAELHKYIAHMNRQECAEPECEICAVIQCVHSHELHHHHDGCPASYHAGDDVCDKQAVYEGYKRLADRVAELEAEARWIPVGERLPDELVDVLVLTPERTLVAYRCDDIDGSVRWHAMDRLINYVTNWRPMPKPPEVQP